jgi:Rps23 Pro-64 3,4-dihydroxylase Tpa1-like proline 4-hydroxylase
VAAALAAAAGDGSVSNHKSYGRRLTCLYYCGPDGGTRDWDQECQGQLRLFLPLKPRPADGRQEGDSEKPGLGEGGEEEIVDVAPAGDRLVVFLSESIPHEVLTTRASRCAVTCWMY